MARLELSDMIVGLRKELEVAQKKGAEENLKFNVDGIEVEAQVTVSMEASAEGKVKWKFWVFGEAEASAGAGIARETVQTIRLKLTPEQGGQPMQVAREDERPD